MIAHMLMGISRVLVGDPADGRAHLDRVIELYDPAEHRALATRFGHDVRMTAFCWRSLSLWTLGDADAARADAANALKDARDIGHAGTSMFALSHSSVALISCGDRTAAAALVEELLALSEEKGSAYWNAYGTLLRGWLLTLGGDAAAAVPLIQSGIATMRSTGATAYGPWYSSLLASAHAKLGQADDARRCIDEALAAMEATGEKWCEAEVRRIAGEIARHQPQTNSTTATTNRTDPAL
jgi:predicted ATPase